MEYKRLIEHLEKLGFNWVDINTNGDGIYSDGDIAVSIREEINM